MTIKEDLRDAKIRPVSAEHSGAGDIRTVNDGTLSVEQLNKGFAHELRKYTRYIDDNAAAYLNRRVQIGQNPTNLRVISPVGIEELYKPNVGLTKESANVPIFRFPPRVFDTIGERLNDEIHFIVMHSFGRGYDKPRLNKTKNRVVAIDPKTGHSPARFSNGIRTFVQPDEDNKNSIHHLISLRGDFVNMVAWDNRCQHGGGGSPSGLKVGINDNAIGIEHEEWMTKSPNKTHVRDLIDQGPFSEQQYALDAFVIKKLEAYTEKSFTKYLGGSTDTLRSNINNKVNGCFNHANISSHHDPGAEFFIPPGFELKKTPISEILVHPKTGTAKEWEARFALWYGDLPEGFKLSAYDRIFAKVARIRAFDMSSEVFDPSINRALVGMVVPDATGAYTTLAAQRASKTIIAGVTRAEKMVVERSTVFAQSNAHATAVSSAWSRHAGKLSQLSSQATRLPVVKNGVAFDYTSGVWINADTPSQPSTAQFTSALTSGNPVTTKNTDPTDGTSV